MSRTCGIWYPRSSIRVSMVSLFIDPRKRVVAGTGTEGDVVLTQPVGLRIQRRTSSGVITPPSLISDALGENLQKSRKQQTV